MPVNFLDNITVIVCTTLVTGPHAAALQNEMITRVAA
jgi:hypothetical protein